MRRFDAIKKLIAIILICSMATTVSATNIQKPVRRPSDEDTTHRVLVSVTVEEFDEGPLHMVDVTRTYRYDMP